MSHYIDLHSHILPGVDDGAENVQQTMEMLQIAYEEGIRCMIATPHFHPHRGHKSPETMKRKVALVRKLAEKIDPKFRIYLGTEIYFTQEIPEQLKKREVLTINGTRYVLVEFSPSDSYEHIYKSIQQLQMYGYEVIVAHVERYENVRSNLSCAEELVKMGALLQINTGSIVGKYGKEAKKYVYSLMEQDLVFGVGTDAHNAFSRSPKIKKAADLIEKKYGKEYRRRIFFDNAASLLRKRKR